MKIKEKLAKKYKSNFKRKNNFIDEIKTKRVARKACTGLWTRMSKFLDDRAMNLVHRRVECRRNGIKLFKWSYKNKEYPGDKGMKMFYFYKLYSKKRK